MPEFTKRDFHAGVADAGVTVHLDEAQQSGNSSLARVTFHYLNAHTRKDETIQIVGDWEREAAIGALRWAADVLENGRPS